MDDGKQNRSVVPLRHTMYGMIEKDDTTTLALDTSHMKGSVAVTRGTELLCEIVFDASDTHSATLMPAVDVCLRTAKQTLDRIERFAVVSGPGSFTGLRIGLATVKAFAAVRRRAVVPVTSLEVIAAAFPFASRPVLVLIDARRGEVYAGLYATGDGTPVELVPPFSAEPAGAVERVLEASNGAPLLLCGTGVERYRAILSSVSPRNSRFADPRWSIPAASLLAVLSQMRSPVRYEDLHMLEPLYIRPPDAKLPASLKLQPGGG
jgi:tRNA threonylcarbamoyladenosine biosynthesis protein TsaB